MSQQHEPSGLAALEARVRHDLEILAFPSRPWVKPRPGPGGAPVLDVLIVGGGQCGLATAFGLLRDRVENILVVDENGPGQEGPWGTYARMVTLRTPKHLTGPDLGIPSLTFRAWYEAQHGPAAWDALGKIPKEMWLEYLCWFRQVLALPVENEVRVERIAPQDDIFAVTVRRRGQPDIVYARKVVLATGMQGGGVWHIPEFIREALSPSSYAHTADPIDFAALRGKTIAVLGAGASAFDNARTALEAGVGAVHVFFRRSELPRVNPIRWMEFAGFLKHFPDYDDATKYAGIDAFLRFNQPPTEDTFRRAARFPQFHLHPGSPWERVEQDGARVRITTPQGVFTADFVIVATGLLTDLRLRPELAGIAEHVACWADRYTPPPGRANPLIDAHPYLGPNFELTERVPGTAPYLRGIFAFNYGALASLGLSGSAISGMKYSIRRLLDGITGQLFHDDGAAFAGELLAYDVPEFTLDYEALAGVGAEEGLPVAIP